MIPVASPLTPRLRFYAGSRELLEAELAGVDRLRALLPAMIPDNWPPELFDQDAIAWFLSALQREPAAANWPLYYLVLSELNQLVGIAGFKGPPADQTVEIGYSILPQFQGEGLATEACRALVGLAFSSDDVKRVAAETLPALVSSIRVLEKCGMRAVAGAREAGAVRYVATPSAAT